MNALVEQGFAIRRDTNCLAGVEVDCGVTALPFRGCCPVDFKCPFQYNIACCPTIGNCTDTLLAAPQPVCANATWDLFDNGGFFCCEPGWTGYNLSNTNGCTRPGASLVGGAEALRLIRAGVAPSPSPTLSTVSLTFSSTPVSGTNSSTPVSGITSPSSTTSSTTQPPQPPNDSKTPVGAIAGGVVGGIAGIAIIGVLAWLFLRRKRSHIPAAAELQNTPYLPSGQYPGGPPERYAHHADAKGNAVHEIGAGLPAQLPTDRTPVELEGAGYKRK